MKTKLTFISSDKSEVDHELECFANEKNEIFIEIRDPQNTFYSCYVCLDLETAEEFLKLLTSEIELLKSCEKDKV